MKWIFKIAPGFLKELDEKMRIRWPWLWATRVHIALYFTLVCTLVFGLLGFLVPLDIKDYSGINNFDDYFWILMIPTVLLSGYYIVQLSLFSVERRNGKTPSIFRTYLTFPITMLVMASPWLMPIAMVTVLNQRIDNLVEDEVFEADVRNFVLSSFFVDEGVSSYRYFENDHQYLDAIFGEETQTVYRSYEEDNYQTKRAIYRHEKQYFNARPRLYKFPDNGHLEGYIRFEFNGQPDLSYLKTINLRKEWKDLSGVEQFFVFNNLDFNLDTAQRYLEQLNTIYEKYTPLFKVDVSRVLRDLKNNDYQGYAHKSFTERAYYDDDSYLGWAYNRNTLSSHLGNIMRAKTHFFPRVVRKSILGILYTYLYITVLLFLFRLNSWKSFLLSLLVFGCYTALAAIFDQLSRSKGDVFSFMFWALPMASIILSLFTFNLVKYSAIRNMLTIIGFLLLPYILPLTIFMLEENFDFWNWSMFDDYKCFNEYGHWVFCNPYETFRGDFKTSAFNLSYLIFFVLGLPFYQKAFTRMMVLPKNS